MIINIGRISEEEEEEKEDVNKEYMSEINEIPTS